MGQSDLMQDLGIHDKKDPRFIKILRQITETARKKGIPSGLSAANCAEARYYRELGFTFFNVCSDLDALKKYLTPLLKDLREELKAPDML